MYHESDIIFDFTPQTAINEPVRRIFRPRIFISYRQDVADDAVRTFAKNLFEHYRRQRVFIEVVSLRGSDRLSDHLEDVLRHCDVFILLVGATTFANSSTAANTDWLHHAIAVALRRHRRKQCVFVPLSVGGARVPSSQVLSQDMRQLATIPTLPFQTAPQPELFAHITRKTRRKRFVFTVRVTTVAAATAALAFLGNVTNPSLNIPSLQTAMIASNVAGHATGTITASCPQDSTLLNGGYQLVGKSTATQVIEPTASYPQDIHTWTVTLGNPMDNDLQVNAIAVCVAASATTPLIVQSSQVATQGQSTALCPAQMVATGGGYNFAGSDLGVVTAAGFAASANGTPNLQGWSIETSSVPDGAKQVAYAVCVAGNSSVTQGASSHLTLSQGTMPAQANAVCSSGHAIGGGYRISASGGAANVITQGSAPVSGKNTWQLTFYNADLISDQAVQYWPICSAFTPTISFFHQYALPVPFWQT